MKRLIKKGMILIHSGNNFKVKSVDAFNVNLTNGQSIPHELIDEVFSMEKDLRNVIQCVLTGKEIKAFQHGRTIKAYR